MARLRQPWVFLFGTALLPSAAGAAITDISLIGVGHVDYAYYDCMYGGCLPPRLPVVGTPVLISMVAHLGDNDPASDAPAPADDFTGVFDFDPAFLGGSVFGGPALQSFRWVVHGADTYGNSDEWFVWARGSMRFEDGTLLGFDFELDFDDYGVTLSTDRWAQTGRLTGSYFGGNWSVIPEPMPWAMMITGFGLAGAVSRFRRSAAA